MRLSQPILATALAAVSPCVLTALGQPVDIHTLLAAPRQRIESADYRASGRMVRVDADGNRLSYPFTIEAHWFPGVLRVLMKLGAASKVGANSQLSSHIPMHILLEMRPGGANVIKIAHPGDKTAAILPFEKWSDGPLGPYFSYEDFLEQHYFWPSQAVLERTKYGARDCDLLKSAPGAADKTHYAEIRTWLDHSIGFPVYVEKTMKATGAIKEFTYLGLRHEGGVWSATQVEVKLPGRAGSTLLIVDRGSAKANLGPKDFNAEQLTRFP